MLGTIALVLPPNADWIERAYVNGAYPQWERVAFAVTSPFPWSLGDLAALIGVGAIVWEIALFARKRRRRARDVATLLLNCAAILGIYAIWFELSWGWNYARAPIEARMRFDEARITTSNAGVLRDRAMAQMNALAGAAHARSAQSRESFRRRSGVAARRSTGRRSVDAKRRRPRSRPLPIPSCWQRERAVSSIRSRSTSRWPPTCSGSSGRSIMAHEWSHDAAYAREDEANYLAIVTCLRSPDPVLQYSGWFELFLYLPQKPHYARREFVPLVWQDFAALRRRNARHVNTLLAHWTWRTYNVYLKSNRIASGVENYDEVTRLMLGIPLDERGLPIAR